MSEYIVYKELKTENPRVILFNVPIKYSTYLDLYEVYILKKDRTNTYLIQITSSDNCRVIVSIEKENVLYCDNRLIVLDKKICNIEELLYFDECLIANKEGVRLYVNKYILGDRVYRYVVYSNDKLLKINIYDPINYIRSVICYNYVLGKEYIILDKGFINSNGLYCV